MPNLPFAPHTLEEVEYRHRVLRLLMDVLSRKSIDVREPVSYLEMEYPSSGPRIRAAVTFADKGLPFAAGAAALTQAIPQLRIRQMEHVYKNSNFKAVVVIECEPFLTAFFLNPPTQEAML